MQTLQPIGDKILVEPVKNENYTKSGIYLPETANNKTTKIAKVVSLGDDKLLTGKVAPRDTVIINSFSGQEVILDNKQYLVIVLNDILGKLVDTQSLKK